MTVSGPDFRQTWLWRQAFQTPRSDSTTEEQEFFRTQYLSIRERAAQLVSRIAVDLPGMTVHDISHLDAQLDTASSVAEGVYRDHSISIPSRDHRAAFGIGGWPATPTRLPKPDYRFRPKRNGAFGMMTSEIGAFCTSGSGAVIESVLYLSNDSRRGL
jgi:hypothetical protein